MFVVKMIGIMVFAPGSGTKELLCGLNGWEGASYSRDSPPSLHFSCHTTQPAISTIQYKADPLPESKSIFLPKLTHSGSAMY